jgi:hypothetical protein
VNYRTDRPYRSSRSGRKKKDGPCVIL